MYKNKTHTTPANVQDFIQSFVEDDHKKTESLELIRLMQQWSGHEPKMWGPTIIGFGSYHYKYESGHEGDSLLIGFSPRKAAFSLYLSCVGEGDDPGLITALGKCRIGKGCIYFKKLSDVDISVLEKLCKKTLTLLGPSSKDTTSHL